jgi:argininosuccinate lyase
LSDFCNFEPAFKEDVFQLFDPLLSVSSKASAGSTGPSLVKKAVEKSKSECSSEEMPAE